MNILVVDNDKEYRDVLGDLLFLHDHTVFKAKGGEEALSRLSEHEIHLIISDIGMPGINGIELYKQLRNDERYRNIPFLYISGYPDLRASAVIRNPKIEFVVGKLTPVRELLELVNDVGVGKGRK